MKKQTILIIACLLTAMAAAFASTAPSFFQMRLVMDNASADTEPMNLASRDYHNRLVTNVLNIQKTVLLDQTALTSANVATNKWGEFGVNITFTKSGATRFAEVTRQNIHRRMAVIIQGRVHSAPMIISEISAGAVQLGASNEQEARDLAKKLNDFLAKK